LIATHYHELIQLEESLVGVKNYSVRVYETEKEVVFMKKIVRGWASKSYGLDVAKLAGIPATIVQRAKGHLDTLEQEKKLGTNNEGPWEIEEGLLSPDLDIWLNAQNSLAYEKMKSLLESYDLNAITPLQALQLLNKIKDDLK
jgi:DNA mismatch repair protein MutS